MALTKDRPSSSKTFPLPPIRDKTYDGSFLFSVYVNVHGLPAAGNEDAIEQIGAIGRHVRLVDDKLDVDPQALPPGTTVDFEADADPSDVSVHIILEQPNVERLNNGDFEFAIRFIKEVTKRQVLIVKWPTRFKSYDYTNGQEKLRHEAKTLSELVEIEVNSWK